MGEGDWVKLTREPGFILIKLPDGRELLRERVDVKEAAPDPSALSAAAAGGTAAAAMPSIPGAPMAPPDLRVEVKAPPESDAEVKQQGREACLPDGADDG